MNTAETIEAFAKQYANIPTTERDALIMQWNKLQKELTELKELEADLRLKVAIASFGNCAQKDGTERISLGMGYELKAVFKQNYKCASGTVLDNALAQIMQQGEEGVFIAKRLVKWEPKLSVSEYKQLPAHIKPIADAFITITPGAPTLELIEPAAKG